MATRMTRCAACGAPNPTAQAHCYACHQPLNAAPPPQDPSPPAGSLQPCPSCGKSVSVLAAACPGCGHPFQAPKARRNPLQGSPGRMGLALAAAALVALVALFLPRLTDGVGGSRPYLGSWEDGDGQGLVLNRDGTGIMLTISGSSPVRWSESGGVLTIGYSRYSGDRFWQDRYRWQVSDDGRTLMLTPAGPAYFGPMHTFHRP